MRKLLTDAERAAIDAFIAQRQPTIIAPSVRAYTNAQMNDATQRASIDTQMRSV